MFREGGSTTAIVSGGRRKVHTNWEDGSELVEEYDAKTTELLVRKKRGKTTLGREAEWEYLVGDAPIRWDPLQGIMKESSQNPIFSRKDSKDVFQWRVRNLPYSADVFSVSVEEADRKIVIRTSNKKYFKRFDIPEMDALKLPLHPASLSFSFANNTLVVLYAKPAVVLKAVS
eukprot:gene25073-10725_t